MTLADLHKNLVASDCHKNDRVIALITACLECGINTSDAIVAELTTLGYNQRHVRIMLAKNKGHLTSNYPWQRSHDGQYQLNS